MRYALLVLILFCATSLFAQNTTSVTRRVQINQNTTVKDEKGTVYPYIIWSAMAKSGEYGLKPLDPKTMSDTSTFILYKLTDEQIQTKKAMQANLPKPAESAVFKVGDKLWPFSDKDMNGERVDSKKLMGKVLVINFWFIGCPPCREEIPDLNGLVDDYKDNKDVVFVAIALDGASDLEDFLKTKPFKYHMMYDGRFLAKRYGVTSYPTNVVIDTQGKIAFSSTGGYPGNVKWMKEAINTSLTNKTKEAAN
jgi:thiol-disulfide isomerase/thioredoxin